MTVERLVVIVPYRDRAENLARFVPALRAHLGATPCDFAVIEQAGDGVFNKGRLMNAGFDLHRRERAYFCFHDVDLLPENEACDYSRPSTPTHLSKYCSQYDYAVPYPWACGGVMLFFAEDFVKINGYSNEFWGWGGEDDDLALRIAHVGLEVRHREGRYLSLPHARGWNQEKAPGGYERNLERLRSRYSYADEGLSSTHYRTLDVFQEPGYVRYLVDVGSAPEVRAVESGHEEPSDAMQFWKRDHRERLALSIVRESLKQRR